MSFKYYNINPYKKHTGDCVIRAIACALEIPWEEASDILYETARDLGCEMSCIGCYSKLFRDLELEEIAVEGMTVQEVAEENNDKIVIIRIDGHLTCSMYGNIYDIWDCTHERADRAWIVE